MDRFSQGTSACATTAPSAHNLSGIESALADGVSRLDQLYVRATTIADSLLGAEPTAGAEVKCNSLSVGRISGFEDRLSLLHHLLGSLTYELDRIERAVQ